MNNKKTKNKYKSRYGAGGMMYMPKYQTGGMYADNQIPAGMGSTAMTVYQESNPQVQEQREQAVEDEAQQINQDAGNLEQELKQDEQQAEMDIQQAGQVGAKFDSAVSTGVEGIQGLNKLGVFDDAKKKLAQKAAAKAATALAAKQAVKAGLGEGALQTGKTALGKELGAKFVTDQSTKLVTSELGKGSLSLAGKEGATMLGKEAAKAGLGEVAKSSVNPNALAMAANIGGKAISMASDDGDATKWNAGEVTGDVLGKAGEYAGYGAMIGSVVPGVGNVVGAGAGAVIGATVAGVQGLTGRKNARKLKFSALRKKRAKIQEFNSEVKKQFGKKQAIARAGALKQKTYSGYDLGQNVSYKHGGYNRVPSYAI